MVAWGIILSMNALLGIFLAAAIFGLIGSGVIVYLGLQRQSKDQWRKRVYETSQEVQQAWKKSGGHESALPEPTEASFDEVWAQRSESGSAYLSFPPTLEHRVQAFIEEHRGTSGQGDASASGTQASAAAKTAVSVSPEAQTRPAPRFEPTPAPQPRPVQGPPPKQSEYREQPVQVSKAIEAPTSDPEAVRPPRRMPAPAEMPPSYAPKKSHWIRVSPVDADGDSAEQTDLRFQLPKDDRSIA